MAVIITKLNYMHQGKVFFDYSQEITGKIISKIIVIFYVLFYFISFVYLKEKLVMLIHSNFLPNTPPYILIFVGVLFYGFIAYKGITNIARLAEIIGVLFLLITVITCIMMLFEGMNYNILPFLSISDLKHYKEAIKGLAIPFTGLGILFVVPFTVINKKAPKVAFISILVIAAFYVLIVESTMMILGLNNATVLKDSFIEAVKVLELPIIERTDVFYLTFGLTSIFAGLIIIYTTVLEYACKFFPKIKRIYMVIIIGALIFISSILLADNEKAKKLYEDYSLYTVLIATFLIPTIIFVCAKIKKKKAVS